MRYLILTLFLFGCGDTPDKDPPNNGTSNSTNNATSGSTNNATNSISNGTNSTNNGSCAADTDCELGEVCQVQANVCIVASCEFCTADQVCYRPTPDDAGSCSAPQCSSDDDCGREFCRQGVCSVEPGCTTSDDCSEGEICNIAGECVTE